MRDVSLTLQNDSDSHALVQAITADNPGATVKRFPAMVKIDCPGKLVIHRETVEAELGRDFDLQELQLSMISLAGNVDEDDDTFTIAWS